MSVRNAHVFTGDAQLPMGNAQVIMGVNSFSHDTAACLLMDGDLVAFAEEERFNRDRHTKAFPEQAMEFCLSQAGISMAEVDVVAVAHKPLLDFVRGSLDGIARVVPKRVVGQTFVDARLLYQDVRLRKKMGFRGRLVHVGHHQAHAASAFFASPFDQAAVMTLDRGGDFLSATLALGMGSKLLELAKVRNPHSLGEVYTAVCQYLGFPYHGDEGKVMGLAPYGSPGLAREFSRLIKVDRDGRFKVDLTWFSYQRDKSGVSRRFEYRYGQPRVPGGELTDKDKDVAFAVQDLIERSGVEVGRALRRVSPTGNVCLAGGVALNSVMNTKILERSGFDRIFVQPAASDAGNALGAALWTWHHLLGNERRWSMGHAYWGPSFEESEAAVAMKATGLAVRKAGDPAAEAARMLAEGKIVGWFQGRAEVGPRALGARSVLADPRRAEMRDLINDRVKHREWFRPFAPSVLHEHGADYFEEYLETPFMLLVLPVRKDKAREIPAVTHVDGTARVQSVTKDGGSPLRPLLERFHALTGVPVALNTSFNLAGEPIVLRPEEAVADFLASEMDALVIGGLVCEKPGPPTGERLSGSPSSPTDLR